MQSENLSHSTTSATTFTPPLLMVNGLPGHVARMVCRTALGRGVGLVPYSLTGEAVEAESFTFEGIAFELLKPAKRDQQIAKVLSDNPGCIAIDYTHPDAVQSNVEFYVRHRIPFIMGTTGGDREKLMQTAKQGGVHAVIAPNMAKQIVAFQAMIDHLANTWPNAFAGYKVSIVESHQKTKADTSGTAKAIAASLRSMGLPMDDSSIEMVRDEASQIGRMQVPAEHLGGHAYHTYTLDAPDGSVHFEFRHNVNGRQVYAEGTLDAVDFLAKRIRANEPPRVYNMMDILNAGGMQ